VEFGLQVGGRSKVFFLISLSMMNKFEKLKLTAKKEDDLIYMMIQ